MMTESENFEAVVVGSGFGGTIAALTLANYFEKQNPNAKVCVLERGQWWLSHEMPATAEGTIDGKPTMRTYLEENHIPHGFWAHPDNVEGQVKLLSMARQISRTGLYDYRILAGNVHAITASGVGGGSLVYSNVTLRPHPSVYRNWPTEKDGQSLGGYFDPAEKFIGINKITTVTGLSNQMLARSQIFQEAAKSLQKVNKNVINTPEEGYDLNLSITDLPSQLFQNPTPEVIAKYQSPIQTNVCQRQARCNLGCIPGARHTLNKRLFMALTSEPPKPLAVKPLCEAYRIEYSEGQEFPYAIHYKQIHEKTDQPKEKTVLAKRLIVSAGTLGTNELLFKSSRSHKRLKLGPMLGQRFSTDGDLFGYMKLRERKVDITRGPVNTSHAMFKTDEKEFAFSIEDTSIPPMLANFFATILELFPEGTRKTTALKKLELSIRFPLLTLETLSELSLPTIQKMVAAFSNNSTIRQALLNLAKNKDVGDETNLTFLHTVLNELFKDEDNPFASPAERLMHFFVFSCMGIDNADGILDLKSGWEDMERGNDLGEKLTLDWRPDQEENRKAFQEIIKGMRQLADQIEPGGGQRAFAPTWKEKSPKDSSLYLLHPLGGCRMGDSIDTGVVNSFGEVFRPDGQDKKRTYQGFYVIDGSIIPSALGVNSSLTIAAVAFRCLDRMVGSQFWPT